MAVRPPRRRGILDGLRGRLPRERNYSDAYGASGRWIEIGPLDLGKARTADANGNADIIWGVPTAWSRWDIDEIVCSTDQAQTAVPYPVVTVYRGAQTLASSEGSSWIGNQVTLRGRIVMDDAEDITVHFGGGVAGSRCAARVGGTTYLYR